MIIQRVYKGIVGLQLEHVEAIFEGAGIYSNWWADAREITPQEVIEKLAPAYVTRHLNDYDEIDPVTRQKYGARTAFISTTAGSVVGDADGGVNEGHCGRGCRLLRDRRVPARRVGLRRVCVYPRPPGGRAGSLCGGGTGVAYLYGVPAVPARRRAPRQGAHTFGADCRCVVSQTSSGCHGRISLAGLGAYVQNLNTYVKPERLVNYRDVLS